MTKVYTTVEVCPEKVVKDLDYDESLELIKFMDIGVHQDWDFTVMILDYVLDQYSEAAKVLDVAKKDNIISKLEYLLNILKGE